LAPLVAVVDQRNFTASKASASGRGVKLTYARRQLPITDQIGYISGNGPRSELVICLGTPSDFIASLPPSTGEACVYQPARRAQGEHGRLS
jgi:hypothetical protein